MYNQWEKAVAPTLEQVTASDGFRDAVAMGAQITRAVTDQTEKASRQWLHMWNLPAAGDIRSLRRQIASLDREVQSLRRSLNDAVTAPVVEVAPDLVVVETAPVETVLPEAK